MLCLCYFWYICTNSVYCLLGNKVMKRKFKQWWPIIPSISPKNNNISLHTFVTSEMLVLVWDRQRMVAVLNRSMWPSNLSPLDNWTEVAYRSSVTHSSDYSPLITCGSTVGEILVSLNISCGNVALMVLCHFSDICGP